MLIREEDDRGAIVMILCVISFVLPKRFPSLDAGKENMRSAATHFRVLADWHIAEFAGMSITYGGTTCYVDTYMTPNCGHNCRFRSDCFVVCSRDCENV